MTKEEHDALMATRQRPVTDRWLPRRNVNDPAPAIDITYLLAEQARRTDGPE